MRPSRRGRRVPEARGFEAEESLPPPRSYGGRGREGPRGLLRSPARRAVRAREEWTSARSSRVSSSSRLSPAAAARAPRYRALSDRPRRRSRRRHRVARADGAGTHQGGGTGRGVDGGAAGGRGGRPARAATVGPPRVRGDQTPPCAPGRAPPRGPHKRRGPRRNQARGGDRVHEPDVCPTALWSGPNGKCRDRGRNGVGSGHPGRRALPYPRSPTRTRTGRAGGKLRAGRLSPTRWQLLLALLLGRTSKAADVNSVVVLCGRRLEAFYEENKKRSFTTPVVGDREKEED